MRITGYSLFSGIFVDFEDILFTAGLSKMLKDDQYLDDDTDEIFPMDIFRWLQVKSVCVRYPHDSRWSSIVIYRQRKSAEYGEDYN